MNNVLVKKISLKALKDAYRSNKYDLYSDGRLNLFGVRSSDMKSGVFNDVLGIYLVQENRELLYLHSGTVDPGTYYLQNPINKEGTAVMKFQFVPKMFVRGLHKGYDALVQSKPAYFYRITKEEFEKDNVGGTSVINLDNKKLVYQVIGCNMHRASQNGSAYDAVGAYSAACQVRNNPNDHMLLMRLVGEVSDIQKDFDYALFSERDFNIVGDLDPKSERRV